MDLVHKTRYHLIPAWMALMYSRMTQHFSIVICQIGNHLENLYMLTGFWKCSNHFPYLYRNLYNKDVLFRQHIYVSLYKGAFSNFGSGTRGGAETGDLLAHAQSLKLFSTELQEWIDESWLQQHSKKTDHTPDTLGHKSWPRNNSLWAASSECCIYIYFFWSGNSAKRKIAVLCSN